MAPSLFLKERGNADGLDYAIIMPAPGHAALLIAL